MKRNLLIVLLIASLFSCKSTSKTEALPFSAYNYTTTKKVVAGRGAVVSAHVLASKSGTAILKAGGNAFDAAVATQLSLAVVFPVAGNIGGGGFLVGTKADGQTIAIDYREMAPAAASRDMYIDSSGAARTDRSQNTHLSSGVPGAVAGILASARYGRLEFSKLIAPAIELAANGFVISAEEANSLNGLQGDLKKYNSVTPVFVKEAGWKAGDTLVQTDLAHTLERIRDKGLAGFYEGETAALVEAEMKRGNGIITKADLKNYVAKTRDAHVFSYKGYKVVGMPMPSSGGILVNQMMKMIEPYPIASMGFQTAASVQLMTEAERRAYADRAEYMGDPDFYKVPMAKLGDSVYLVNRMKDYQPGVAGKSSTVKAGLPNESTETTHFSVIDNEGNAVSVTTTLNGGYGNRIVVGGAGFFLNNEMDDFSIKAGVPNMFGAVGGDANSILPGKRMLSSMTPTIVLRDDKPFLVLGTPGGTTIPTSVFQSLVNIIEFNMSTEDALYKAKFHHQWLPDEVYIEPSFSKTAADSLRAMGYKLVTISGIGRTEIIRVLPDGKFEAVADNRGEDAAEGW
ncbi:MAG: gamma-glutamyltransferase [Chitinophagaceae bacterium]|nr:MAG: gamma-glutamyltransferase [Chitinophagaceae bacterium]